MTHSHIPQLILRRKCLLCCSTLSAMPCVFPPIHYRIESRSNQSSRYSRWHKRATRRQQSSRRCVMCNSLTVNRSRWAVSPVTAGPPVFQEPRRTGSSPVTVTAPWSNFLEPPPSFLHPHGATPGVRHTSVAAAPPLPEDSVARTSRCQELTVLRLWPAATRDCRAIWCCPHPEPGPIRWRMVAKS